MFRVKNIIYFDAPGPQNTDKVVDAVVERLAEGDIKFVIVASITGETALKIAERIKHSNLDVKVI
ncbi:MAG: pyruvate kinase alpha/beta domain-containing protein, partial [Candidatus Baldrarchaeia archaeon]